MRAPKLLQRLHSTRHPPGRASPIRGVRRDTPPPPLPTDPPSPPAPAARQGDAAGLLRRRRTPTRHRQGASTKPRCWRSHAMQLEKEHTAARQGGIPYGTSRAGGRRGAHLRRPQAQALPRLLSAPGQLQRDVQAPPGVARAAIRLQADARAGRLANDRHQLLAVLPVDRASPAGIGWSIQHESRWLRLRFGFRPSFRGRFKCRSRFRAATRPGPPHARLAQMQGPYQRSKKGSNRLEPPLGASEGAGPRAERG